MCVDGQIWLLDQALKRLGPKREAPGTKKAGGGKATVAKTADERSDLEKKQFDELTEWADQLIRSGEVDIYQQTKDSIKKKLDEDDEGAKGGGDGKGVKFQEEPVVMRDKIPAMWEYRGEEDGQVHGPYTTAQILAWRAQGFFTGPSAVGMRQVQAKPEGGGKGKATSVEDLMADLDDDEEEDEEEGSGKGTGGDKAGTSAWVSSDSIDFSLYC